MDSAQRRLERSWRASGSVEDEARWLTARVRSGGLSTERLDLAACCDHEAARLALEGLGMTLSPTSWVTDLQRWGSDVCLRAAWFAARGALPVWTSAFAPDRRPARALRLLEAWLERDPSASPLSLGEDEVEVEAARASELAQLELAEAAELAGSSAARLAEDACVAAYFAARGLQAVAREQPTTLAVPSEWIRRRPARRSLSSQPPSVIDDFLTAERRAARAALEAPTVTRARINAEVAAWCLGSGGSDSQRP